MRFVFLGVLVALVAVLVVSGCGAETVETCVTTVSRKFPQVWVEVTETVCTTK